MKTTPKLLTLCIALLLMSGNITAQVQSRFPKWLPENGNWMVETNVNRPLHAVIYFYTNEGEVIYKETIEGMKLNLDKKKVKMRLKKVLETALTAWYNNKQLTEEQQWVAKRFR